MKAYEYNACVFRGEVYCNECLPTNAQTTIKNDIFGGSITFSRNSGEVHPIFADSEWDSYPVCSKCGKIHDYVVLLDYAIMMKEKVGKQP